MTPDQVRALLGSPDETATETTETGAPRREVDLPQRRQDGRLRERRRRPHRIALSRHSGGESRHASFPFFRILVARRAPPRRRRARRALRPGPPATKKDDATETIQGVEIADPYRWLEDQNVARHAGLDRRAERLHAQRCSAALPGRAALEKRLGELLKVDVLGIPTERRGRYFFSRRRADKDLPILYVRQGLDGKDEVLIDPLPLSPDHSTSVSFARHLAGRHARRLRRAAGRRGRGRR